jgi:hypothetical protein
MVDTDQAEQDDNTTKLKAVSVINHLNEELGIRGKDAKRPTVIAQSYTHDVCFSLLVYGVDRIISLVNMKYSLLAFSSLFPGFLSIINNLTVPSNYYNVSSNISRDNSVVSKRNEYDWGESFELVEIPVKLNTSDGMKKLTFSLCCRFLYEWSKGTTILVGVFDHAGCDVVVLNPLRDALIGDCGSLFVICNSLEVTLAMLQTSNPKRVWRRQKSQMAQQQNKKPVSAEPGTIELQSNDSFWKGIYQDPNALQPTRGKFNQFGLQKRQDSFDPKQLKFSRDASCFRKKTNSSLPSLVSVSDYSQSPGSSLRREKSLPPPAATATDYSGSGDDVTTAARGRSNSLISTSSLRLFC